MIETKPVIDRAEIAITVASQIESES